MDRFNEEYQKQTDFSLLKCDSDIEGQTIKSRYHHTATFVNIIPTIAQDLLKKCEKDEIRILFF